MGPEVSVVITCYRGGKFLAEAIDSVLSQTFRDFEIVLVDNNANEETRDVMRRYLDNCPNVIRSVLQPEQGAPSARNMGILESRGTFISLLDDDDFMYSKKLERQYRMAQSSPEASLIGCGVNYFESESGRILLENVLGGYGTLWGIRENLFKKLFLLRMDERQAQSFFFALPSTMFFRKETATSAGLFDVIMNPSTAEDIEFFVLGIRKQGDLAYIGPGC